MSSERMLRCENCHAWIMSKTKFPGRCWHCNAIIHRTLTKQQVDAVMLYLAYDKNLTLQQVADRVGVTMEWMIYWFRMVFKLTKEVKALSRIHPMYNYTYSDEVIRFMQKLGIRYSRKEFRRWSWKHGVAKS